MKAHLPLQYTDRGTSDIAVATGLPSELMEALRSRAERLHPFTGGQFEPSPPPVLLDKLTDQLLVVASNAVTAVAAETVPLLSGKATLRLLAWVVADARGATTPLEKALAETVGKRLEKQAQKVRETLAAATADAAEARESARAAAAQDADLAAALAAELAAIDALEQGAYDAARDEVANQNEPQKREVKRKTSNKAETADELSTVVSVPLVSDDQSGQPSTRRPQSGPRSRTI